MDRAAGILRQISAALEPAHAKQVVHCDLKPSNRGHARPEPDFCDRNKFSSAQLRKKPIDGKIFVFVRGFGTRNLKHRTAMRSKRPLAGFPTTFHGSITGNKR